MPKRPLGIVFLAAMGIAAAAYAYLLNFTQRVKAPTLTGGAEDRMLAAAAAAVLSAVSLLIALVLVFSGRPKPDAAEPAPAPARLEPVVIKRTEMNFRAPDAEPDPQTQARLEEVDAEMGRLKVRFGLGEIGNETFARLMAQLEEERARLETPRYPPAR